MELACVLFAAPDECKSFMCIECYWSQMVFPFGTRTGVRMTCARQCAKEINGLRCHVAHVTYVAQRVYERLAH